MEILDLTVWELMIIMLVGMITAFPLVKLSKNLGNNIGIGSLILFSLLPMLQLVYLYFLAFSTNPNLKSNEVVSRSEEEKDKNSDAWKTT